MGLHVPKSRLLTWRKASEISGPVAMVSQSGGNAQDFVNIANRMGLYFSKVISYGNALNLDSTDYLAYLAEDDDTKIIAMYLEGVKNGRRLVRLISDINRIKPVVMVKGGWSESGARTVASHTGALAGGEKIWRAFYRQTGVVPAATLQEMADIVLAFRHLPPVRGRNVAILGTGGGIGVAAADSCAQAGLAMPALSEAVMLKLRQYIPPAGNMIRNPIDAHILLLKLELMGPTLQLLSAQPDLDMFVFSLHLDWLYGYQEGRQIDKLAHYLVEEGYKHTGGKPIAVVWRRFEPNEDMDAARHRLEKILRDGGIAVYEGLDRALAALSKVADYYLNPNVA
jgi:acyl-CoA synthetase (NDP forming)